MGLYQGAEMIAGAGTTPSISIDDNTKHWIINGIDTGIVAEGKTPTLGLNASGYITVNGTATTIKAVSDYNNLSNRPIVSGKAMQILVKLEILLSLHRLHHLQMV